MTRAFEPFFNCTEASVSIDGGPIERAAVDHKGWIHPVRMVPLGSLVTVRATDGSIWVKQSFRTRKATSAFMLAKKPDWTLP